MNTIQENKSNKLNKPVDNCPECNNEYETRYSPVPIVPYFIHKYNNKYHHHKRKKTHINIIRKFLNFLSIIISTISILLTRVKNEVRGYFCINTVRKRKKRNMKNNGMKREKTKITPSEK